MTMTIKSLTFLCGVKQSFLTQYQGYMTQYNIPNDAEHVWIHEDAINPASTSSNVFKQFYKSILETTYPALNDGKQVSQSIYNPDQPITSLIRYILFVVSPGLHGNSFVGL